MLVDQRLVQLGTQPAVAARAGLALDILPSGQRGILGLPQRNGQRFVKASIARILLNECAAPRWPRPDDPPRQSPARASASVRCSSSLARAGRSVPGCAARGWPESFQPRFCRGCRAIESVDQSLQRLRSRADRFSMWRSASSNRPCAATANTDTRLGRCFPLCGRVVGLLERRASSRSALAKPSSVYSSKILAAANTGAAADLRSSNVVDLFATPPCPGPPRPLGHVACRLPRGTQLGQQRDTRGRVLRSLPTSIRCPAALQTTHQWPAATGGHARTRGTARFGHGPP